MKKYIGKVIGSTAIAASLLASGAGLAFAQNATTTTNDATMISTTSGATTNGVNGSDAVGPAVPGVPNTGAGGDATGTMLLLGVTGLIAVAGGSYLLSRRAASQQ